MAIYPELAERVVAITGAAQGIGAATARAFAEQGAETVLLDLDLPAARQLAEQLSDQGRRATALAVDVTDSSAVRAAFGRLLERHGRLDVLVNCAGGYGRLATIEDTADDEWDRTVALNLRSVFLCSRAAIEPMKRQRFGRIVNIASISGRTVHAASSPAYGASKAGVIQLTRFLAYELGPHGITANVIAPITTLTPRVAALRTEDEIARIAAQIPLRRLAVPDDHASVMLFLASDAASYLNGVVLDVNGGRVML